ncbi:MAG: histidine kinase [Runella slithyformis]|nr:MAG: histidine kinase [Runella slithyformis]
MSFLYRHSIFALKMKKYYLILWCICSSVYCAGQSVNSIDTLPEQGFMLNQHWKWQIGDNPDWANPEFDDSGWQEIDPTQDVAMIPQLAQQKVGWFRTTIEFSPLVAQQLTTLLISQSVASEVYINGLLAKKIGVVSTNPKLVEATNVLHVSTIGLPYSVSYPFVQIAIRTAYQDHFFYNRVGFSQNYCLRALVIGTEAATQNRHGVRQQIYYGWFQVGVFFILTFLHLSFFLLYRRVRANLYFSVTTFFLGVAFLCIPLNFDYFEGLSEYFLIEFVQTVAFPVAYVFLILAIYEIYNQPRSALFWLLVGFAILMTTLLFTPYSLGSTWAELITELLMTAEVIRVTALALRKKQPGARLIMTGMLFSLLLFLVFYGDFLLQNAGFAPFIDNWIDTLAAYQIAILCVPLSISLYLAINFSKTNQQLIEQLQENNALNQKNLLQEQERQHFLTAQNELLEKQVKERTLALETSLADLKETQSQLVQREKLASLGELTAGIAHEIQNPLNFVNNFSELSVELIEELKSPLTPDGGILDGKKMDMDLFDDVVQNLGKINHHGKRASSIVKGMLEHSRTSTGVKELTDINMLADEYLRLSYHGLRAKDKTFNANFELIAAENLPPIKVVSQDIGRVLLNSINNAFYAVSNHAHVETGTHAETGHALSLPPQYQPTVTISTHQSENQIVIKIKDNGIGMNEATKAKIFQPFFTTKPTGQGTGLGLSLAYDIITKGHGGTIEVESEEGQGTTFIVKLPC